MAEYQGHRSWNAWNVALWMGSDEGTYRLAMDCLRRNKRLGNAAREFLSVIGEGARTPDGGRYNFTTVREALSGFRESMTD